MQSSADNLQYPQVFVISSDKIFKENYSNMYTLMITNSESAAAKMVLRMPRRFQPAMYLLMHCLLCWIATLAAVSSIHSVKDSPSQRLTACSDIIS